MAETVVTRWKCVCAYDGTDFSGWQSQPGKDAIQDSIEARLGVIFGQPIRIHGSGRTDAGVHARGQVFHFDAAWRHGPAKLHAAMRVTLPRSIQIRRVRAVPEAFHARYGAKGKIYHYHLVMGDADPFRRRTTWTIERSKPLDVEAMVVAAAALRGTHDFAGFAAFNGTERETTVRELRRLDLKRRGRHLRWEFEADGFLYKMVRSLMGALVAVGEGKLTLDDINRILTNPLRTAKVPTAPPQGLFLERVFY